jgi:two-component system, sensor histidine kinase LadS
MKIFSIVILLYLILSSVLQAQEGIVLEDKNQLLNIGNKVYFLEDATCSRSIQEIASPSFRSKFTQSQEEIPNYGITSSAIWMRIEVQNLTKNLYYLVIRNPAIDSISIFIPTDSATFLKKSVGSYLPSSQREINTNLFALQLTDSREKKEYYLRLYSTRNLLIPIEIGTKDAIWEKITHTYWIDALYFGLLIAMIFYNLFIFLSLRTLSFLYYVLYGASLFIGIIDYQGYTALFSPFLQLLFHRYPILSIAPSAIFILLFTMSFLRTFHFIPKWHQFLKVLLILFIVLMLISITQMMGARATVLSINILGSLMVLSLCYIGLLTYRKNFLSARYYLFSWTVYLLLIFWVVLIHLGVLPAGQFLTYHLQLGSSIEMLILSLALADRINILEKEKMDTQEKLFASLKEKERILDKQNTALEEKVKQRTDEIHNKQSEIIAQNEELTQQQEELLRQQKLMETQQKELTLSNKKMMANEAVLRKAYFKIAKAQETIAQQNEELKQYSEDLEKQVQDRTQQIVHTNQELVKQNNQLEQFAFITAHNLRAPVARLLGLSSILDTQNPQNPDNPFVIEKMVFVAHELETVIKDLNVILEIKKGINEIREEVKFSEKLNKVCALLQNQIAESKAQINVDFSEADSILSVSPYVESIMYNLVSNAIKYRSLRKVPLISIQTKLKDDGILLTITDNGLGMDLTHNQNKIFGLYRRFHDHIEGKGLGLYLIKTQIEALGGTVSLESILGEGTTFYVFFKKN